MDACEQVTKYIAGVEGWRGKLLEQLRQLIRDAAPEAVEEWKWRTPVWSQKGNLVSVGAFQDHVKINFFQGASLPDPHGLFNAGLDAKASRAIDLHQGDPIRPAALKDLMRAAVAFNAGPSKPKNPTGRKS